MAKKLEDQFHDEMLTLFDRTYAESNGEYWPRYFLQEGRKIGGLASAKKSPRPQNLGTGFGRIADLDLLHLSIDHSALLPKWASFFTMQELREARKRLENLGIVIARGAKPRMAGRGCGHNGIHVHHLKLLAEIRQTYVVHPI